MLTHALPAGSIAIPFGPLQQETLFAVPLASTCVSMPEELSASHTPPAPSAASVFTKDAVWNPR